MASGHLDLFVENGETFSQNIELSGIAGTDYDLSSYSVKSEIKKSFWSANTTTEFNASIVDNGTTGTIFMYLTPEQTANLTSSRYVYDIFLTEIPTGNRSKLMKGTIYVNPSATGL